MIETSYLVSAADQLNRILPQCAMMGLLNGFCILVNAVQELKQPPLCNVFEGVNFVKVVKDRETLQRAASGPTYEVMGFVLKQYKYGKETNNHRVVCAPIEGQVEGVEFNGRHFDSVSIMITDDPVRFRRASHSGVIDKVESCYKIQMPYFAYTTDVSPFTLRFMILTDCELLKSSTERAAEPKEAVPLTVDDMEYTSFFDSPKKSARRAASSGGDSARESGRSVGSGEDSEGIPSVLG